MAVEVKPQPQQGKPQAPAANPGKEQLARPAAPTQAPTSWIGEAEAYLESRGWKRAGFSGHISNWHEPERPRREDVQDVGMLPTKDGEPATLRQLVCDPLPWVYRLEEAVQRQRDKEEAEERDSKRKVG